MYKRQVEHARITDRSSGGCSDIFLTDARRAEALATTASPNSVENSSCGEEAINWMLPFKKAASPGRSDRELTPCSRAGGGQDRSCNGVPCPFGPVDGLLCPGCCHSAFLSRPPATLAVRGRFLTGCLPYYSVCVSFN